MADTPKPPTRVIGIDPGLNVTGYGIVVCRANEVKLLEAGVIRMPRRHGESLPERLESLFVELRRVIEEFNPEAMCLEEVYSHANYPRTAILMGHARGVICLAAPRRNPGAEFFRQASEAVHNGQRECLQAPGAARGAELFPLHRVPYPPDVADALAVALCYLKRSKTLDLRNHR